VELEPRTWAARTTALLQLAVMIAQGFVPRPAAPRASALAYFTVLSMVPLLAIAVSIVGSLGVGEEVARLAVAQIAGSPDAQAYILGLIENANFRGSARSVPSRSSSPPCSASAHRRGAERHLGRAAGPAWTRRLPDYLRCSSWRRCCSVPRSPSQPR